MINPMKREQLRRICRKAEQMTKLWKQDFPGVDDIELFHFFRGALTSPQENMRQLSSCAKFFTSFDSSKRKKSSLS